MSIDRIGKGGVPTAAPHGSEVGGASAGKAPEEASRPFEVHADKAGRSEPPRAADAALHSPLARLRAGQIDMPAYLDLKVQDATAHLQGVRPAELDAIRKMLRDQLATDPALVALVKQATGHAPPVPDDE
jgi:hypothetical protein